MNLDTTPCNRRGKGVEEEEKTQKRGTPYTEAG